MTLELHILLAHLDYMNLIYSSKYRSLCVLPLDIGSARKLVGLRSPKLIGSPRELVGLRKPKLIGSARKLVGLRKPQANRKC